MKMLRFKGNKQHRIFMRLLLKLAPHNPICLIEPSVRSHTIKERAHATADSIWQRTPCYAGRHAGGPRRADQGRRPGRGRHRAKPIPPLQHAIERIDPQSEAALVLRHCTRTGCPRIRCLHYAIPAGVGASTQRAAQGRLRAKARAQALAFCV